MFEDNKLAISTIREHILNRFELPKENMVIGPARRGKERLKSHILEVSRKVFRTEADNSGNSVSRMCDNLCSNVQGLDIINEFLGQSHRRAWTRYSSNMRTMNLLTAFE
jgi:hypothetical protein